MSSQEFKQFLRQNNLLLPEQPIHDDFLDIMKKVFHWSFLFGVYGSKKYISMVWSSLILGSMIIIEIMAIWKVIKAFAGIARDTSGHRSITARLAGTIFYSIAIISLILASKLCYQWKNRISIVWANVERSFGVKVPADRKLKRRVVIACGLMTFCSIFEHVVSIIASVGLDCPSSLILKQYVLVSHGFIFMSQDYSEWFALPLAFVSTIATLLWNFQDQLIVLISLGLTSRYCRLNQCLAKVCALEKQQMKCDEKTEAIKVYTWRKIREAYVKQAMLVRTIDVALGGIIILSCSCNFYFICLQMFLVITQGMSSDIMTGTYYLISLAWLCIRVISVVLAASGVNVHSQRALKHLYTYETHRYNVEVERLQDQLTKDYIALSGMGFFYLNKTILLQMAGAIITYELVLIQFDDQGNNVCEGEKTTAQCIHNVCGDQTLSVSVLIFTEDILALDFLPTLNNVFLKARYMGISSYGLTVACCWSLILFLMLLVLEGYAICHFLTTLEDQSARFGLVSRLSGSIFYANALLSLLLSSKFVHSWRKLSAYWLSMETAAGFSFAPDVRIKKRVIFVTVFVATSACVEHILSMMSATGFNIPPEEYFYRYILSSHGFLLEPKDYSIWIAVPIFILSKLATAVWNFQDLIIILISMGLTSRYHRLNLYVNNVVMIEKRFKKKQFGTELYLQVRQWRRLREAYVRQATLVRMVDSKLGGLVLLSNINNLYFICLQLFFGIHKDKGSVINRCYYLLSVSWLIIRACSVVLAASDVHLHSKRALKCLHSCPNAAYNIEIKRLQYQLSHDFVALTGMGYFSLRRELLLEVAAAILKYELVLIQYDS